MQEGPVVVLAVVHEAVALLNREVAVLREAAAAVGEVAEVLKLTKHPLKLKILMQSLGLMQAQLLKSHVFTGQPRKAPRCLPGGPNLVWPVLVAMYCAPEILKSLRVE